MGGTLEIETFNKCSESDLRKFFNETLEELREVNGNQDGYSGDWQTQSDGLTITNKEFVSEDEAEEWIDNNTEKWNDVKAVKIFVNEKIPKSIEDKLLKIENKIKFYKEKIDLILKEIVKKTKILERKKKCLNCDSNINLKFCNFTINNLKCPICNNEDFLITISNKEKINNFNIKINELNNELNKINMEIKNFKLNNKNKDKWYWMLGAWCAC